MEEKPKGHRIQIELPEDAAQGIYSNLVIVSHSPSEFVLDFTRVLPGLKKAKVYSRIILSPKHAKFLLKTLSDNIEKFEGKFGKIKIDETTKKEIGF
ncbi:hypothetical protein CH333_06530 [candidate division WOR-3 bacterium JGI_Cruoil_03_44_89]|uniref:DUF3467 domain-containing protein n=1 Tax=candidate division WOR-3 bacterium JGI_Cruoil_03_44_89 TaxID=1973748 RepID=A0A235BSB7_UNCW3|nr:MAG: hypothetical protein CH333_06530 [candidate division WOR-3 bacterium JGI_Cruoil_03_44_89]